MKFYEVTVVRIYLTEKSKQEEEILHYLKNEAKLHGASIFRAISGFGSTGKRSASLLDLSLDLPLVIEFYDQAEKIKPVLEYLQKIIKAGHIISWTAQCSAPD